MSMLAETRRRKNYVLTPRAKPLYDVDDSRYGCKMLQKMGWTKGKGLGAKESGNTDFVRVKIRGNLSGLGFDLRDDQWTEHENGFNGLLQSLNAQNVNKNGNDNEEQPEEEQDDIDCFRTTGFGFQAEKKEKQKVEITLSGESLEEKSKKSKARVHYKKFTKCKDLSQYSAKDLANIFGKKTFEANEENQGVEKPEDDGSKEGKTVSISDYFKEKMEKRKRNRNNSNSDLIPACIEEMDNKSGTSITEYFKRKMEEKKSKKKEQKNEIIQRTEDKELNDFYSPVEDEMTERKTRRKEGSELKENEDNLNEEPVSKKRKKSKSKTAEIFNVEPEPESDIPIEDQMPRAKKKSASKMISSTENCKSPREETLTCNRDAMLPNQNEPENVVTTTTAKPQQTAEVEVSVRLTKKRAAKAQKSLESENNLDPSELNVCTISSYAAEKFRRVDLDSFRGSNLKSINGYAFHKDMTLNISKCGMDEKRIIAFWEGSGNKYSGGSRIKEVHTNTNTTNPTKTKTKTKKQSKPFNIRFQKRKSAFKLGI